jgi:hypothetical protein
VWLRWPALIFSILTVHACQLLWIYIILEPSALRNSVTTLCIVHISTMFAILHCCCVGCTWLTGAPMILVELDSVIVLLVGQETLPSATLIKEKNRRHYFYLPLVQACPCISWFSICGLPQPKQKFWKWKKELVRRFQNVCWMRTGCNVVKSSSSNTPNTWLNFLCPHTHASLQNLSPFCF